MSNKTTSFQTVLGLPRQFWPTNCPCMSNLGNLLSAILQIWPNHLSLLVLSWDSTWKVSHRFKMTEFVMWSNNEMPQIRLKQRMWKTDSWWRCLSSKDTGSPLYNNTVMTMVWRNWSLVDKDKAFDDQILAWWSLAKALLALATLWAISVSSMPSEVNMLPRYLNWETTSSTPNGDDSMQVIAQQRPCLLQAL